MFKNIKTMFTSLYFIVKCTEDHRFIVNFIRIKYFKRYEANNNNNNKRIINYNNNNCTLKFGLYEISRSFCRFSAIKRSVYNISKPSSP